MTKANSLFYYHICYIILDPSLTKIKITKRVNAIIYETEILKEHNLIWRIYIVYVAQRNNPIHYTEYL